MTRRFFHKDLILNKKASFDYEILEKFEAGIVLLGTEVKSLKAGKANLTGSYVVIKKQTPYLLNSSIPPYQTQNVSNYDPSRTRQLLLKRKEIQYLDSKLRQQKLTLIPLRIYDKNGLIKIEIALAKRKKTFDKREALKQKEIKKKIQMTRYLNFF